jgi:hypothetical protein
MPIFNSHEGKVSRSPTGNFYVSLSLSVFAFWLFCFGFVDFGKVKKFAEKLG